MADVVGPEGPIGTVAHIVIDEATRELSEVVVRSEDCHEWVVPAIAITDATRDTVRLNRTWSDLRSDAREYAPDEFDSISDAEVARLRGPVSASRAGSLELREEELRVRKETRELGAVELRKDIVAERQPHNIPVWLEELIVERQLLDPPQRTNEPIMERAPLRIVLRQEVAIIETRPVVTDVVRAGRRTVEETQHVEAIVRREVANVQSEGGVSIHQEGHPE